MADEFGFVYKGHRIDGRKYGEVYFADFHRILKTHAPEGTRAILEWGGGVTTQYIVAHAEALSSIEVVLSIDHKADYQEAIFADRPRPQFLQEATVDLTGSARNRVDPGLAYATYPLGLRRKFDLIFIDGRRRMECAFIASMLCHETTTVVIHDYRRTRYQPILALFEPIEDGEEFRVLKLRPAVFAALRDGVAQAEASMT